MNREIVLPPGDADPLVRSAILADARQRRLLALLAEATDPRSVHDLAIEIVAAETGNAPSSVPPKESEPIELHLHHCYLPMLEEAGWVERRPEGVVGTDRLRTAEAGIELPDVEGTDVPWETVAALVARPRRQELVSIIAAHRLPFTLDELQTALHARDDLSEAGEHSGRAPVRARLHHVDLPRLDEVGLIEYDVREKAVTGKPGLPSVVDWREGQLENGDESPGRA